MTERTVTRIGAASWVLLVLLILVVTALGVLAGCDEAKAREQLGATPEPVVSEAKGDAATILEETRDLATVEDLDALSGQIDDVVGRLEAIIEADTAAAKAAVQPIRDVGDAVDTFVPGAGPTADVAASTSEWVIRGVLALSTLAGIIEALRKRKLAIAHEEIARDAQDAQARAWEDASDAEERRKLLVRAVKATEQFSLIRNDEQATALKKGAREWAGPDAVAELQRAKKEPDVLASA